MAQRSIHKTAEIPMELAEFRNAEIVDGPKGARKVKDYGNGKAWINEVAENGRDHPAFTSVGWWQPGRGGERKARVIIPWITLDIDDADDIGGAYETAVDTIKWLYRKGFSMKGMYASFSGGKGFHITVPGSNVGMPVFPNGRVAHYSMKQFFDPLIERHPSIDTNPMSPLILIRLTGSTHSKTGNRKWTIPAMEFGKDRRRVAKMVKYAGSLSMEQVHESDTLVGKFPHPLNGPEDADLAREMSAIAQDVQEDQESGTSRTSGRTRNDPLMPPEVWAAFQGVAESERWATGHSGRNEAAFMLACYWLRYDRSPEETLRLVRAWDKQRNDPPLQEDPDEADPIVPVNSAIRTMYHDNELDTMTQL